MFLKHAGYHYSYSTPGLAEQIPSWGIIQGCSQEYHNHRGPLYDRIRLYHTPPPLHLLTPFKTGIPRVKRQSSFIPEATVF